MLMTCHLPISFFQLYVTKMTFNERLIALRNQKKKMISEAEGWSKRLDDIQGLLPVESVLEKPHVPELMDDEIPERLVLTDYFNM